MLVAQPMAHHDLADLPDDLAAARAVIQALVASFGGRALGVAES